MGRDWHGFFLSHVHNYWENVFNWSSLGQVIMSRPICFSQEWGWSHIKTWILPSEPRGWNWRVGGEQFPREGWRILFLKRQNNRFQPYFQISFLTIKAPLLFPYTSYCFLPLSFLPTPPSCFIYKTLSLLFQEDLPASVLCYQLYLYKYLN